MVPFKTRTNVRVAVEQRAAEVTGVVPEPRLELGRSCEPRSLSPLRLPFRHSGRAARVAEASMLLIAVAILTSACSAVPNLDQGSAGCQNATGIGLAIPLTGGGTNIAVAPNLHDLTPSEAGERATQDGHTVVFNADGTCWCVPPATGTVTESWFSERGALWLWVDGADVPDEEPPFLGWGC
jgi:hypothetical protein